MLLSARRGILALLTASAVVVGLLALLPAFSSVTAPCTSPWTSSSVYTGGMTASHDGHNWQAKWWTQGETPGTTGESGVWADQGACTSGGDGGSGGNPNPGPFVVSEAQFKQMFPSRNPFYTYDGLTAAVSAFPAFATTGSDTVRKQEAAAFLANVAHETKGLASIVERDTANYPHYCDAGQSYGCPAGQAAYYGRGPIQLSWNFNYKAAGDALGIDLLAQPSRVEREPAVAWKTGLWYWNTQSGPGTVTGHGAMVDRAGFGQTIRSINGSLECDGKNPEQVRSRVSSYQRFAKILGVPTGGKLSC
ncbi:glycoside hydrolase family 19 protein [Streptomyces sp. NPDC059175]|uniref:glycoside hydrolase family 19 protein n=1 Tax=unclassified Streptomyces TaxID=2593676 RepID=UPI0036B1B2E6